MTISRLTARIWCAERVTRVRLVRPPLRVRSWKAFAPILCHVAQPPPEWIAAAARATRRLRATTRGSRGASHHVYIALLEDPRRACRWGLYVGETPRDPDQRFDQHKNGYKASGAVTRFGVRLLPELVAHLNPLRRWEAVELEPALAQELARAEIQWVAGGH